jgi:hypothetical protein
VDWKGVVSSGLSVAGPTVSVGHLPCWLFWTIGTTLSANFKRKSSIMIVHLQEYMEEQRPRCRAASGGLNVGRGRWSRFIRRLLPRNRIPGTAQPLDGNRRMD